jgi:hypothetical protein
MAELSMRELIIRHGVDPADELMKYVYQELPYPEDEKELLRLPDWEPFCNEKGQKKLRLGTSKRIEVLKELMQYSYAKLRNAEVRGQVDYNINVSIKSFSPERPALKQPAIDAEVVTHTSNHPPPSPDADNPQSP